MLEARITRITRMKETGRCDVFIRVIRVIRGLLRPFLQPLLGCGREPALGDDELPMTGLGRWPAGLRAVDLVVA